MASPIKPQNREIANWLEARGFRYHADLRVMRNPEGVEITDLQLYQWDIHKLRLWWAEKHQR